MRGTKGRGGSKRPHGPASVRIERLPHAKGLDLPAYQTAGAAGLDLLAAVDTDRPVKLKPRTHVLVPTGLRIALPPGYEAQVRPRSGLAMKHGVTVLNSPGTIDSDYRGEVGVLLVNLGSKTFKIRRGERIAQLVIQKVEQAVLVEVTSLDDTARGAGGFGSTGVGAARKNAPASGSSKAIKTQSGRAPRNAKPARKPKSGKHGRR